ncbi:NUDIX hydrolase [Micromonospora okii]|uniref:NUDIX hydrolase n=1 Tax=Micromonospora okii TaxID=1182970 RepID=UPI001E28A264|nr:NUDIX hydrolase [Micromonospora okii]
MTVERVDFADPAGRRLTDYYLVQRADVSLTCAVTEEGEIVLVRQYRCGINRSDWELPGGGVEPGEDPAAAARRELFEEAGFVASAVTRIGVLDRDAAGSAARIFVFLARGRLVDPLRRPKADEPDQPAVGLVAPTGALKLVLDGAVTEQSSVAAIFLALAFLGASPGGTAPA